MKKPYQIFVCLLASYAFVFGNIFFTPKTLFYASAKAEKNTYAKALENCVLYKSQSLEGDISNVLFIVPETYFVTILGTVSEECLKVQYDKFIGFAKASSLTVATFTPIVKTLENITLDIKSSSGTQVWSQPSTTSEILATISAGFKNIHYIAACHGTIPSGGESNLWFYVSYTPRESTNVYEGYIYSENTTNLSEIVANSETNPEEITSPTLDNVVYLSSTLKAVIIAIITIPIVMFLLIILYKSTKKIKIYTNKQIKSREENPQSHSFDFENNTPDFNRKFEAPHQGECQKPSLREKLAKMKDLKFLKKSNYNADGSIPKFPDYDPDDDIL